MAEKFLTHYRWCLPTLYVDYLVTYVYVDFSYCYGLLLKSDGNRLQKRKLYKHRLFHCDQILSQR